MSAAAPAIQVLCLEVQKPICKRMQKIQFVFASWTRQQRFNCYNMLDCGATQGDL